MTLLVVGHGTRSEAGVAAFGSFLSLLRRRSPGVAVGGGFIELSAPALADVVAGLVADGHRDFTVVPLVLVAAGHAKGDVPAALAREARRHPGTVFRYGRALGPHPVLLAAVERNLDAVLSRADRAGTAVVLVGRGSTDPDANAEHARAARLFWEGRGIGSVEPAFVSLAAPDVPAALDRCHRLGARRVVVVPYFLFPGVLPDRVAAAARSWAAAHPDVDLRCADVIGGCDDLADLVFTRYREALAGDVRVNCDMCQYRVALPGFEHRVGAPQVPHDHPHDRVVHA